MSKEELKYGDRVFGRSRTDDDNAKPELWFVVRVLPIKGICLCVKDLGDVKGNVWHIPIKELRKCDKELV